MKSRILTQACALAALALMTVTTSHAATEPPPSDPALEQRVDAGEQSGTGQVELATGHVDMGPKLVGEDVTAQIRDDTATPPVWRQLSDVALRVSDKAKLDIPNEERYAFLGSARGKPAYVVPQTQNPDVIWVGWNTQDPAIVKLLDRGVTMTFKSHDGPGDFHLFVESGAFDVPPEQLWNGQGEAGQKFWVDLNTHTHANWVFTEPGVHLVSFTISAKTKDGAEVSADGTLRFAVGSEVSLADTLAKPAATQSPSPQSATPEQSSNDASAAAPSDSTASDSAASESAAPSSLASPILIGVIAAIAAIGALAALFALRAKRLRAQARQQ